MRLSEAQFGHLVRWFVRRNRSYQPETAAHTRNHITIAMRETTEVVQTGMFTAIACSQFAVKRASEATQPVGQVPPGLASAALYPAALAGWRRTIQCGTRRLHDADSCNCRSSAVATRRFAQSCLPLRP